MKLSLSRKTLAAVAALAVAVGGATLSAEAANAAVGDWESPSGTDQGWFLYSLDDGALVPSNTKITYDAGVVAAPSATDVNATFDTAPADATGVKIFISPRGSEGDMTKWNSWMGGAFMTDADKRVLQPTSSMYQFPIETFAAVKAAGGDYSVGLAYTKNNGVTLVGTQSFAWITIEKITGDFTYVQATPKSTTPADTTGQIAIEAPVAAPVDGKLSLSVPTGAKATLGAATLDNQGRSVSTGTLPTFTVSDERYSTKPGWTVNASVAQFTSGANTFDPSALSIAPVIDASSTATGVTKPATVAGAGVAAKFAEAAAGAGTGVTKLSAALSLTAPQGTPAGTYTSTMTVTVVSK